MNRGLLILDDEIEILHSLKRLLRNEDYNLYHVSKGSEALKIIQKEVIGVVISDFKMTEMDGIRFLNIVKEKYPDIVRIILSGYIDLEIILDAINSGEIYRFVTKPWDNENLKEVINDAFIHYETGLKNKEYMRKIVESNCRSADWKGGRDEELVLYDNIIDSLPYGIIAVSRDNEIIKINQRTFSISGKDNLDIPCSLSSVLDEDDTRTVLDILEGKIDKNEFKAKINNKEYLILIRKMRKEVDSAKGVLIINE